jgi:hypothetical protein
MNSDKTELENKMHKLYNNIDCYKLYSDILPDDIPIFINELTVDINKLEEEYDKVCHDFFQAKNKKVKKPKTISIRNLDKINIIDFNKKCKKLNLSAEQINKLREKRRKIKSRMYSKRRRDKLKVKNEE